jgi:hypothetical protein
LSSNLKDLNRLLHNKNNINIDIYFKNLNMEHNFNLLDSTVTLKNEILNIISDMERELSKKKSIDDKIKMKEYFHLDNYIKPDFKSLNDYKIINLYKDYLMIFDILDFG